MAILIAFAILIKALCANATYTRTSDTSRRSNRFDNLDNDLSTMESTGLDKETLDSLPIAEYKSQNMNENLESVVCLSKFEETEKLRVLPNCNQSFHAGCINMWLHSHTSCPICRQTVPSNRPPSIISSC
ncbi:hypothetical protein SUGI_0781350 [Cryptomeria japonica]|nr:hypothetical protein SUGI_0781350 [Cryptomeria japonica]